MTTLMHEGGFPMWFILIVGLVALVRAAQLLHRPDRRTLAQVKGLAVSTFAITLGGIVAALGATFHNVAAFYLDGKAEWPGLLMMGLGESMAPGILGFTLVALVALVAAVGAGRLPPDAP